jgi:hypothetical protein
MQDLRSLFNQALSVVGSDPVVTDPNAVTKATSLLQLWYPVARRAVFTSAHWPSLRAYSRLAISAVRDENVAWVPGNPAPEFLYAFALPADLLLPQYLEDFSRFSLTTIGTERVLNANSSTPILCYTKDDDIPTRWEPDLYLCVVWSLAACINMAKNGKAQLTQKLEQQVTDLVGRAAENAANADDTYFDAVPSFYNGTDFYIPGLQTRFVYPTSSYRLGGIAS